MANHRESSSLVLARELGYGRLRLGEGFITNSQGFWLQSDPRDKGRTTLVTRDQSGVHDLTPEADLRTSIHSYGGGALGFRGEDLCYYDRLTSQVWVKDSHDTRPLTGLDQAHYAGFTFLSNHEVVCVREDPHATNPESLVVIDLAQGCISRTLSDRADFYFSPAVSSDGWISWMEYDHGYMPWDTTRIMVMSPGGEIEEVDGGEGVSNLHPQWESGKSLIFLRDESGFWNFYRWQEGTITRLHDHCYDFCEPPWVMESPPYALVDQGIGCSWWVDGMSHLGMLDSTGNLNTLGVYSTSHVSPAANNMSVVSFATPTQSSTLSCLDWATGTSTPLAYESEVCLPGETISIGRHHTWTAPGGEPCRRASAWFYPPTTEDEAPPLLVLAHSGPTSFSTNAFSLIKQFFTSRGIGILDVNYAGSSTLGRAARESLNGYWGITDVDDCVDAAQEIVRQGKADENRLAIMGSSAGGFTVLRALTTTSFFSGGISVYGIADLELLDRHSERFESHYTSALIGATSAHDPVWVERSPVHHVTNIRGSLLLLQGEDDTVVPPAQALAMYEAAQVHNIDAELVIFPAEGHGFRQGATIEQAYTSIIDFLSRCWGLNPSP